MGASIPEQPRSPLVKARVGSSNQRLRSAGEFVVPGPTTIPATSIIPPMSAVVLLLHVVAHCLRQLWYPSGRSSRPLAESTLAAFMSRCCAICGPGGSIDGLPPQWSKPLQSVSHAIVTVVVPPVATGCTAEADSCAPGVVLLCAISRRSKPCRSKLRP